MKKIKVVVNPEIKLLLIFLNKYYCDKSSYKIKQSGNLSCV